MSCEKCGYNDKKEEEFLGKKLCQVCATFAPQTQEELNRYVSEKIDWKILETFRKNPKRNVLNQKLGMDAKAEQGQVVSRAPLGYKIEKGELVLTEESAKVHSLFKTFLEKDYSLNSLAKNYGLSVNGLKKVLKNRTYLGEVKFDGKLYKGSHKPLISAEIFYAVQRKLKEVCR